MPFNSAIIHDAIGGDSRKDRIVRYGPTGRRPIVSPSEHAQILTIAAALDDEGV